jgi:hypothetical protein
MENLVLEGETIPLRHQGLEGHTRVTATGIRFLNVFRSLDTDNFPVVPMADGKDGDASFNPAHSSKEI